MDPTARCWVCGVQIGSGNHQRRMVLLYSLHLLRPLSFGKEKGRGEEQHGCRSMDYLNFKEFVLDHKNEKGEKNLL